MRTRVTELHQHDQTSRQNSNLPNLSYAAVTVLGIQATGVEIAKPAPVRTLMHNMQEQNRLRTPAPIQGTPRLLIAHSLETMLRQETRPEMISEALINLISLARKPAP